MSANQVSVHPSVVSIPAPLYKIGQQVDWTMGEFFEVREFTGIVTGQTYRIDYMGGKWEYNMAITKAVSAGKFLKFHVGGHYSNVAESRLSACIEHE
ncbi:hypothetical protein [Nostoc sp.]|uniref:hypothetical protein n=1 Tax=Nostoc sp. TaxID=1180 RepID=UPI002FFCF2A2